MKIHIHKDLIFILKITTLDGESVDHGFLQFKMYWQLGRLGKEEFYWMILGVHLISGLIYFMLSLQLFLEFSMVMHGTFSGTIINLQLANRFIHMVLISTMIFFLYPVFIDISGIYYGLRFLMFLSFFSLLDLR